MLAYYFDHDVHGDIVRGLRRRGIDLMTAYEDGRHRADDEKILARSSELQRVLVTHDDDLLRIAKQWQSAASHFAGLIFVYQYALNIGLAVQFLHTLAEATSPTQVSNAVIYAPRRST